MTTVRDETGGDQVAPAPAKAGIGQHLATAVVPLAVALIALGGVVMNGNHQLKVAREQLASQHKEDRAKELRDLRRPIYQDFQLKANKYATAQSTRRQECRPGTDQPRTSGIPCTVGRLTQLQTARYEFQRSINAMSTVESTEAGAAADRVAAALPPSLTESSGGPVEGTVDEDALQDALVDFMQAMRCDTNPTARCEVTQ